MEASALNELLVMLEQTRIEIAASFGGLPSAVFFDGSDERWSPGHHLKHLVLSNKPVAHALTLPRGRFLARDAARPHRPFSEIRALYQDALSTGAYASGPFLPTLRAQAEAVAEYSGAVDPLEHGLLCWTDFELGRHVMSHPVLGPLSVREMLFFTVYHNQHHLNGVKASLEPL